jgi:hypothetical protein
MKEQEKGFVAKTVFWLEFRNRAQVFDLRLSGYALEDKNGDNLSI